MSENTYDSFFENSKKLSNISEDNDFTKDSFGEDRLDAPSTPNVGDIITNEDGTTEEVIKVEKEIVLGYWKCLECYTESDGNQKICTSCGIDRPLNPDFYVKEDSKILTNQDEIDEARSGPDWKCTVCSDVNGFNTRICPGCGTDQNLGGTKEGSLNAVYNDSEVKEWDNILENDEDVLPKEQEKRALLASVLNSMPGGKKIKNIVGGAIVSLLTLFGANEVRLNFTTHVEKAKVESKEWERKIYLDKLIAVDESSWNTYPSNAYNINKQKKIHHHDKVKVGEKPYQDIEYRREKTGTRTVKKSERVKTGTTTEQYPTTEYEIEYYMDTEYETKSLGNGKFERVAVSKRKSKRVPKTVMKTKIKDVYETRYYDDIQDVYEKVPYPVTRYEPIYENVPNYQDHFTYTVDKRVYSRVVEATGNDNNPQRPSERKIHLKHNERIGKKTADYDVCFRTDDGESSCIDLSEREFAQYRDGEEAEVLVNGKGKITDINRDIE